MGAANNPSERSALNGRKAANIWGALQLLGACGRDRRQASRRRIGQTRSPRTAPRSRRQLEQPAGGSRGWPAPSARLSFCCTRLYLY